MKKYATIFGAAHEDDPIRILQEGDDPIRIIGKSGGPYGGGLSEYEGWDGQNLFVNDPAYFNERDSSISVIGAFDPKSWADKMNTLKVVPVGIARILLRGGFEAIHTAQSWAKQPWYKPNLPGEQTRANVEGHLKWHQDALDKLSDPNSIYASGDDLKTWVLRAYLEQAAAEEGNQAMARAWNQMWFEIGEGLKALPAALAKEVNKVASNLLGVPTWAWGLAAGGLVAAVGVGIYFRVRGSGSPSQSLKSFVHRATRPRNSR